MLYQTRKDEKIFWKLWIFESEKFERAYWKRPCRSDFLKWNNSRGLAENPWRCDFLIGKIREGWLKRAMEVWFFCEMEKFPGWLKKPMEVCFLKWKNLRGLAEKFHGGYIFWNRKIRGGWVKYNFKKCQNNFKKYAKIFQKIPKKFSKII